MSGKAVDITDADFEALVLNSPAPMLVDFWAPWCGPCRMMAPVLEAISEEHDPAALTVGKLNIDENPETTKKYSIMSIPTLVLFRGGVEAGKLVGFLPKDELKKRIAALLQDPPGNRLENGPATPSETPM